VCAHLRPAGWYAHRILQRAVFEARRSETPGYCQETWSLELGLVKREEREQKRRGRPRGSYEHDLLREIVETMVYLHHYKRDITLDNVAERGFNITTRALQLMFKGLRVRC
jgi:hypothetical protein